MDKIDKFNDIVDKLEPMLDVDLTDNEESGLRTTAIVSIAISLKRIADVVEKELATMIIAGREFKS